jgi:5-methylthioadenosine/S-adenosylhomocysteine deaminase
MSVLFRSVNILDLSPDGGMSVPTDVLVSGGIISEIGRVPLDRIPTETRVIDGQMKLLMPGLINGHFHSSVNHMKGSLDSLPLEIFMLYESPALDILKPTPREAYLRTMIGALEMLRTGVTAVQDDAFFVPDPTPAIIDAVMQAYSDSGIRATVALDQPNVAEIAKFPFLGENLSDVMKQELSVAPRVNEGELLALYDHLIKRWHGHDDGRLNAAVSCSAPQRVTPRYALALAELSRVHGLPFYAHMLETKLQRVFGIECLGGRSIVKLASERGILSERTNVIHSIWIDDQDLDLIAEAGSVIAHNPISNLRLGSGIMPFRHILDRQIPVCLGSDEAIADDAINMWGVAKTAGLIHNLGGADYDRWPKAHEVLSCMLLGGARAMGKQKELGAIEVGKTADLILVDLDTNAFTPLNDLHRQLVYCENGSSVQLTMVQGRILFEDGRVTSVDEKSLRAEIRDVFDARRGARKAAEQAMHRWLPPYRAMYNKASAHPVGLARRLPADLTTAGSWTC